MTRMFMVLQQTVGRDDDDDDEDDDDDKDEDVHGVAADSRDAARPIRQDLSNWVTVDGPPTLHKKSKGGDEFWFKS